MVPKCKHTFLNNSYNVSSVAFIIKRGKIGIYLRELLQDMRNLMYPYTAMKLKESRKNSLKDFVSVAGQFGVSHMMIMT